MKWVEGQNQSAFLKTILSILLIQLNDSSFWLPFSFSVAKKVSFLLFLIHLFGSFCKN